METCIFLPRTSVYVDDFKVAGPENNMKKGWSLLRRVIATGDSTNLGKYLGCGHERLNSILPDIIKASVGHIPLLSSQARATRGCAGGDAQHHVLHGDVTIGGGGVFQGPDIR